MIVCTFKDDIYTQGISAALTSIYGEKFKLWQVDKKPVYDMLDELNPDFLLYHKEYWSIIENPIEDFRVTTHELKDNLELANVVHYHKGEKQKCFTTDIIYWSRTEPTQQLIDTLWKISSKYSLKVFGPVRLNTPYYLGNLDFKDMADALASAKLNLNFNNHSSFDAIINGTFSLMWSPELDLLKEIEINLKAKQKIKTLQQQVWNKFTFHHEISKILTEDTNKILADLKKYQ